MIIEIAYTWSWLNKTRGKKKYYARLHILEILSKTRCFFIF
jgi:hypothetical protein